MLSSQNSHAVVTSDPSYRTERRRRVAPFESSKGSRVRQVLVPRFGRFVRCRTTEPENQRTSEPNRRTNRTLEPSNPRMVIEK